LSSSPALPLPVIFCDLGPIWTAGGCSNLYPADLQICTCI
jgi:hypothetical protein